MFRSGWLSVRELESHWLHGCRPLSRGQYPVFDGFPERYVDEMTKRHEQLLRVDEVLSQTVSVFILLFLKHPLHPPGSARQSSDAGATAARVQGGRDGTL